MSRGRVCPVTGYSPCLLAMYTYAHSYEFPLRSVFSLTIFFLLILGL